LKNKPPSNILLTPILVAALILMPIVLLVTACRPQSQPSRTEEVVFYSDAFKIVGDLRLPEGRGPHPVVVFVHGDGPNDRVSGGTYLPIMARMEKAGYATFAWDKPGTGESSGQIDRSHLVAQRAQIVVDAINVLAAHEDINSRRIGLWGISQAGYVMPRVLTMREDIAFMIAISCPAMAGVDQGSYLVSAQAVCAGVPQKEAEEMRRLLSEIERVQTYDEYVHYKERLDALPGISTAAIFGYSEGVKPKEAWHVHDPESEYFWDPMEVIVQITIPVLAFFGEKDTQIDPIQGARAYQEALTQAGNPSFRVELIPGTDHNIILSETGCIEERERRSRQDWTRYAPEYLDILEAWLRALDS
jgi:pimeloyl-ACP methyl ester carboxylesterase